MKEKQTGDRAEQNRRKKIKRQIARTIRREERDFLKRLMKFNPAIGFEV